MDRWCISTTSFLVLISGTPSGFFRSTRGLRQGNLLSSYLFILVMEGLSQLLFRARYGGFIGGFKVGRNNGEGRYFLHLLFVDDTLIFCEANSDQLRYLSLEFLWFMAISGLKVNRDKSESIPVGRMESFEDVVLIMVCRVGKLPTSYLGLPLGVSFKSSKEFFVG